MEHLCITQCLDCECTAQFGYHVDGLKLDILLDGIFNDAFEVK